MNKKDKTITKLIDGYVSQVMPGEQVLRAARLELYGRKRSKRSFPTIMRFAAAAVCFIMLATSVIIALPFLFRGNDAPPEYYSVSALSKTPATYGQAAAAADGVTDFVSSLDNLTQSVFYVYSFSDSGETAFVAAQLDTVTEEGSQRIRVYFEVTSKVFDEFDEFLAEDSTYNATKNITVGNISADLEYSTRRINGEYLGRFSTSYGSVKIYAVYSSSYPF